MSDVIIPAAAQTIAIGRWLLAPGTITVRLFKNDLTPSYTTVIGDFTEADYAGYSGDIADLPSPEALDSLSSCGPIVCSFDPPDLVATQDVYGWYMVLDDGGGPSLAACARFDGAPITLTGPVTGLLFEVRLNLFEPDHGAEAVELVLTGDAAVSTRLDYSLSYNYTVTARDANGFVANQYTGSVSFSLDGGTLGNDSVGTLNVGPPPPHGTLTDGVGVFPLAFAKPNEANDDAVLTVYDGTLIGNETITCVFGA